MTSNMRLFLADQRKKRNYVCARIPEEGMRVVLGEKTADYGSQWNGRCGTGRGSWSILNVPDYQTQRIKKPVDSVQRAFIAISSRSIRCRKSFVDCFNRTPKRHISFRFKNGVFELT